MFGSLLCCLAFSPPSVRLHRPSAAPAAAVRSRPLYAPMVGGVDLPFLEVMFPDRLVADMCLRQGVYGFRLLAGLPGLEGALAGADLMADARLLLTSSTVGTFKSAFGFASAVSDRAALPLIQHSSMLLHHPIMLCHFASRHMPAFAPGIASVVAARGRSVCAGLWLAWIAAFGLVCLRSLRESKGEERALGLTLRRLALDVPIACHYMLNAALLPLALVGLLGSASSWLGMRAAAINSSDQPPPRVTLPLPRWPLRQVGHGRSSAHACTARRDAACSPRASCGQQRRRIGGGPLSCSCEW